MGKKKSWLKVILLLALIPATTGFWEKKESYKIGFLGPLTGRQADLGVAGRNGAILAVEEINKAGGIGGRPIELLVEDDRNDPREGEQAGTRLIKAGVLTVVGPMTSGIAEAVLPLMNREGLLLISPTVSANSFSGKDDFLIRLTPPNFRNVQALARHALQDQKTKTMAVVYDLANRAYAEEWANNFISLFTGLGGEIIQVREYRSEGVSLFEPLARELTAARPEGILIVGNALDTALLCQKLKAAGNKALIYSSGWAMSPVFIQNSGRAGEGVIFFSAFDPGSTAERYLKFQKAYQGRFGALPSFGAATAYEAVQLVRQALSQLQEPNPRKIKSYLLARKRFPGLQGDFELDTNGEARRSAVALIVSQGRFQSPPSK
ncbi:MAG: ABC transporter substrate-binding protein [Deltaproteobacteria bacterium]|nr:ABC transporter substrate-binding protein [Deltaproteobacteria bacterium]